MNQHPGVRIALAAGLLLTAACAHRRAHDLAGGWAGTWTRDGDPLAVAVAFTWTGDHYEGSFDADALQVAGIPFANVTGAGGRVHFELAGDATTAIFDGTLAGDAIGGSFVDGDAHGTFSLARAARPAAGVRREDVRFLNGAAALAGTVLSPTEPGRHAGIVFLHGSGPEGRWANRYLATKFAERGVVALIYDKRGVSGSTGDWQSAGFDELADDAAAATRWLRARADVDPARIGIYGHSQGGTLAPLVAARDAQLAFIVASAAGGIDPAAVEAYSVGNSIGLSRLPDGERAQARQFVDAIVDVAYRGGDRAALDALAAGLRDRAWHFEPPPPSHSYWAISKRIAGFDPARAWDRVTAPVLLVYGARDERVPPDASAQAIQEALAAAGNHDVTLRTYPDADHTFTIPSPRGGWPRHTPSYADDLIRWVLARK